ncbi:MAG: nitroreductase family protein [Aphanothece sp. CMT-3BRIN-NPC111]|jgi:nitroreductase|nr:nitroreductase family protein [Aphanothece sp. CMT-3BRIN-NPC111]
MDKSADTKYPIETLLQKRWSPRAFSDRMVEPSKLHSLLEAARWAPSSYNEQPWSFIIATKENQAEYDRLLSCLVEANQAWAQQAPVLMLSVAKHHFERNGKENRHAFHDVGSSVENLTIQGMALDIFVHQMAGFDIAKARELFSIPEGYEPVAAIALGYLGDPQTLSEQLRERELAQSDRKPLEAFVFTGSWGQTSPLLNS